MTASRVRPRAAYAGLTAYDVEASPCDLELADNTSAWGPPPSAVQALRAATADAVVRYPTTYSRPLRIALAQYIGVAPDEVMVGAGSDEIMSCAFRAFGDPGARVAHQHPTFVMARVFAQTNSLVPVAVPLTAAGDADAEALLATGAEITYLCTPNNPTGTLVSDATRERVASGARGLVMIDEAYAEFAGTNLAREAPGRDGVLVLRTFSKAFGMAGLRVGYAVGARALIVELEKARGPYAVTAASEQAAHAALVHDLPWVMARVAETRDVRDAFAESLRAAGYRPLPSAANFVLVPVRDAAAAASAMATRGIRIRAFAGLPGIGDALRITVAGREAMARVVDTIRACAPCS